MENMLNKIMSSEEKIFKCINLLEIAKSYCESKFDKCAEVSAIGTILDIILQEQKELADCLDGFAK